MRPLTWILLASLALPAVARAEDDTYLQRFEVNWRGGGQVKMSLTGSPWRVSCHFDPTVGANTVTLSGRCRLWLLFFLSKSIVAKLNYETASDSYSGTYVVDDGPPALLSGRRIDDVLTLNVQWPMPVNDHLDAIIRIFNDTRLFTLTTIDPIGIDGSPVVTSDLSFTAR